MGTLGLSLCLAMPAGAEPDGAIRLRVVGTSSGYSQYETIEAPFWQNALPKQTDGRLTASIAPYDRSGMRPEDLLRLVQLGVVSVATLPLAVIASEEPAFGAPDLPLMQDSVSSLRAAVGLWRPELARLLRERDEVELLAVHSYPAQVVFCAEPIGTIADLAGRKVRVSGPAQADLMTALGAEPVLVPFQDITASLKRGQVNCVITGGQPGLEIGLQQELRYFYTVPVSWNLNVVITSAHTLAQIPPQERERFMRLLRELENRLWEATAQATSLAALCASGDEACPPQAPRGNMILVGNAAQEHALRERLVRDHVLPAWARRCGEECRDPWNETIGKAAALPYPSPTD